MKEHGEIWLWLSWLGGGFASAMAGLLYLLIGTRGDLAAHKLYAANNYVKKDDLKDMINEMLRHQDERMDRFETKLDRLMEGK